MSRVLLVQSRRFGGVGAVLTLLIGAGALVLAREEWSSGWMALAMSQRSDLTLLCPLAMGIGAWRARREHQAKVAELFAGTPRPAHHRAMLTMTAIGGAVASAYLAVLAVSTPWIMSTADYLPAALFGVVSVGVLAVIAAAWTGLAVGRLVPSAATAPAVVVTGFLVITAAPLAFSKPWLAVLSSPAWDMTALNAYQTVPVRVSTAQGILALSLIVAAMVVLAASRWRTRAVAVPPLVLGLVAGVAVMPRDYHQFTIDPVAQELVCTDDTPRVCVGRAHAGLLPEITPKAREALRLLAKLPDPPTTAAEDTTDIFAGMTGKGAAVRAVGKPAEPGTLTFRVGVDRSGHFADADHLVTRLLWAGGTNAEHCPDAFDTPVARAAGSWLSGLPPVADPSDAGATDDDGNPYDATAEATVLWERLRKLPESQALAKVAAVREAGLQCADMSGLLE